MFQVELILYKSIINWEIYNQNGNMHTKNFQQNVLFAFCLKYLPTQHLFTSASTHAGGGVLAVSGYNTAKIVLKDVKGDWF
ncbi:MAG: hypothetical protein M3209_19565 [Acidobacteriota bacterium]|nr:hypothetical protein [Acidobacteriota bacterium]